MLVGEVEEDLDGDSVAEGDGVLDDVVVPGAVLVCEIDEVVDGVHVSDGVLDGVMDALGVQDDENDAEGVCEGVSDAEGVFELVLLKDGVRGGVPVVEAVDVVEVAGVLLCVLVGVEDLELV